MAPRIQFVSPSRRACQLFPPSPRWEIKHQEETPVNQAARHDASRRLAYKLVEIIAPCLRPEEQIEALREFYAVIRASLEEYESSFDSSTK
jgi:hypothetical protein